MNQTSNYFIVIMMNLFRDGMTFADFWTVDIKKKESDDKSTDLVS